MDKNYLVIKFIFSYLQIIPWERKFKKFVSGRLWHIKYERTRVFYFYLVLVLQNKQIGLEENLL